jgi:hypothetical protein
VSDPQAFDNPGGNRDDILQRAPELDARHTPAEAQRGAHRAHRASSLVEPSPQPGRHASAAFHERLSDDDQPASAAKISRPIPGRHRRRSARVPQRTTTFPV